VTTHDESLTDQQAAEGTASDDSLLTARPAESTDPAAAEAFPANEAPTTSDVSPANEGTTANEASTANRATTASEATTPSDDRTRSDTPTTADEPLVASEDVVDFRARWEVIQQGFVDDPRNAVSEADKLVDDLLKRLADTFDRQHQDLEDQWSDGEPDTEALRSALQRYRAFFQRLLTL
jgi:hypothetical protein